MEQSEQQKQRKGLLDWKVGIGVAHNYVGPSNDGKTHIRQNVLIIDLGAPRFSYRRETQRLTFGGKQHSE